MMLLVIVICLCIYALGNRGVMVEATRAHPNATMIQLRALVEETAWSKNLDRRIRHAYIVGQAAIPIGLLSLVDLVASTEPDPQRCVVGVVLGSLFAGITATSLVIKILQHRA